LPAARCHLRHTHRCRVRPYSPGFQRGLQRGCQGIDLFGVDSQLIKGLLITARHGGDLFSDAFSAGYEQRVDEIIRRYGGLPHHLPNDGIASQPSVSMDREHLQDRCEMQLICCPGPVIAGPGLSYYIIRSCCSPIRMTSLSARSARRSLPAAKDKSCPLAVIIIVERHSIEGRRQLLSTKTLRPSFSNTSSSAEDFSSISRPKEGPQHPPPAL